MLVDEIHNLNLATRSGAEFSDQLKYFAERLPATFAYAGIEVEAQGFVRREPRPLAVLVTAEPEQQTAQRRGTMKAALIAGAVLGSVGMLCGVALVMLSMILPLSADARFGYGLVGALLAGAALVASIVSVGVLIGPDQGEVTDA